VDAIVVNDVSRAGVGFDAERNEVVFLTDGGAVEIAEAGKDFVAERVLDEIVAIRMNAMTFVSA